MLKNDDYTPMEFVVETIQRFFSKTREQATDIMLQVHTKGARESAVYIQKILQKLKMNQVLKKRTRIRSPFTVCDRASITVKEKRTLMIAQELEVSLHMAFMDARQNRHELITVEHLLLGNDRQPNCS